ncbi:hypothetical protein [Ligilactobacillus salivarius]|uniref:hypothetical protein n=1 Tax=Ligilactobacillus salivarius TaxID=1624 RepID=UPI001CDA7099|nr:hypothetical protein [Ligilactobacillus salivarius]
MRKLFNKVVIAMVTAMTLFMGVGGFAGVQAADARSYGTDVSKYQGANGNLGYGRDSFSIAQIGGSINGYIYDQWITVVPLVNVCTLTFGCRLGLTNGKQNKC